MNTIESNMAPWDYLQKRMIWDQLKPVKSKRILDFGSGEGHTASHFALENYVVAVEPSETALENREKTNDYLQIQGSVSSLKDMEDESFDVVLCHNVLEYTSNRVEIINELERLLKPQGYLSVVKHNRYGRVMQMVTLLNNFDHAEEVLNGRPSLAQKYGPIQYYTDDDLLDWLGSYKIIRKFGVRTFWALQQDQEKHTDPIWQEKMLKMESRVSEIESFRAISSLHHLILMKKEV